MRVGGQVKQWVIESEEPVLFDGAIEAWECTLMELEDNTVKRLDISTGKNKTSGLVTAAAQTGIGGSGGDEMTATAVAQAWLVVRRRHQ